jgi:hypothetical protein
MSQAPTGAGMFIATDPSQEKDGIYKVSKSANITTTLAQLNAARSGRDWKIVKFYPVSDLKKLEEFVKSALKNKFMPNSAEWVKVDDAGLNKICNTIETLADIVNNSE